MIDVFRNAFSYSDKWIELSTNECEWCGDQTYCVCVYVCVCDRKGSHIDSIIIIICPFFSRIFFTNYFFRKNEKKLVIKLNDDILKIESNIEKSNTHTQSFLYVSLNIDDDNQWWFWNIKINRNVSEKKFWILKNPAYCDRIIRNP